MGVLLLIVVLAIVMTAFAYGLMHTHPSIVLSSSLPGAPPEKPAESAVNEPAQAQNQEPQNREPEAASAEPAPEPDIKLSPARARAIVDIVQRLAAKDAPPDAIALRLSRLCSEHQRRDALADEVRALLKESIPAGLIVTVMGGSRKEMLRWVAQIASVPAEPVAEEVKEAATAAGA